MLIKNQQSVLHLLPWKKSMEESEKFRLGNFAIALIRVLEAFKGYGKLNSPNDGLWNFFF